MRRTWLPVVVGIVALVAWWFWPTGEARPPVADPGGPAPSAQRRASPAAEPGVAVSRTSLVERQPVAESYPEADLEHPYAFSLDVKLLDGFSLPVGGALVFLAPPMCGFALWPERSNERGQVHLDWRGREPVMSIQVAIMVWGVLQPIRLVRVDAEQPTRVAIAVRGRQQSETALQELAKRSDSRRRRDARKVSSERRRSGRMQRTDELDVLCGRTQLLFRNTFTCLDCHDRSRVARYSTLSRSGTMAAGLHPDSRFRDLRWHGLTGKSLKARQKALEASLQATEKPSRGRRGGSGRVRGTVLGVDGKRAAHVPVAWRGADGAVRRRTETGASGRFRLDNVALGAIELVAGGGQGGIATATVVTSHGGVVEWNCQLRPTSTVVGTALDPDGDPLVDWLVEFERAEGDWVGLTATDSDGRFRFTGVPGAGQCLLWPKDENCRLPVIHGQTALIDATPVPLRLDRNTPTRARVRVHVALPPSRDRQRIDARLQHLDSGRVAQMSAFGFEDAFTVECVPPGFYRVQVGAPGLGWVETGTFDVDGRGLRDLGRLFLPAPGRVRLRMLDGAESPLSGEHAFYRRTPAVDVLVEYRVTETGEVLLSGGEHVLLWRDASGLRSMVFPVHSALPTELLIRPR